MFFSVFFKTSTKLTTWQAAKINVYHVEKLLDGAKSRHKLIKFIGSHAKTRPPTIAIIILKSCKIIKSGILNFFAKKFCNSTLLKKLLKSTNRLAQKFTYATCASFPLVDFDCLAKEPAVDVVSLFVCLLLAQYSNSIKMRLEAATRIE